MRAAFYERYGPAEEVLRIGELPDLEPGPGEVRVRLAASAVNPSDVKARAGSRGPMQWPAIVPHSDGAGVIDALGPDVADHQTGDRVWVYEAQWRRPFGTAAEHTIVPAERAAVLPAATTFTEGACLGIPAMTAHRCILGDGPVAGKTVLVRGGAGRVGFYAVQVAKWAGATVIATVGSADKQRAVEKVGADHVLNHHEDPVADAVRDLTGGAGVDRIVEVEPNANLEADVAVLADHGTVVVYATSSASGPPVPVFPLMLKNGSLRFVLVYDMPEPAKRLAGQDISAMLDGGALRHQVGLVTSLDGIVDAHKAIEQSAVTGCVVLELNR